jgi:hypothetical protein
MGKELRFSLGYNDALYLADLAKWLDGQETITCPVTSRPKSAPSSPTKITDATRKDKTTNHPKPTLAASSACRVTSATRRARASP